MSILKEFREFAVKGNVIDMAVGIIVGAAFGKIVSSLVGDILMPPLGVIIGGVDFSDLRLVLKESVGNQPAVALNYGMFLQTVLDFLIVAWAIFLIVKLANTVKRRLDLNAPAAAPSNQEVLLTEIRDLLRASR